MDFADCESIKKAKVWALLGIATDGLKLTD